ncbi:O-antigen ligase family protein [Turicibacter sanguinis]|uniref:O-antigen ligase family protein n=1 Tax=Turicibacter sanguinis TaxID=154288 RepID=UPI001897F274|nr:O-antigen ligase family protein [Turicibacter sanguinis]
MKKITLNNHTLLNSFEIIIAICTIINLNTIWGRNFVGKLTSVVMYFCLAVLTLLAIYKIMLFHEKKIKICILLGGVVLFNILFILLNGQNIMRFIAKFIFLLIPFVIYDIYAKKINREKNFLLYFSRIMCILATISILFYLVGSILNIISPSFYVYLKWGNDRYVPSYYNLHFNTQKIYIVGINIIRNSGIFTEAPMFAFALSVAIGIQLFIEKTVQKKKLLILLLALFTTFSTTGIVITSIMLVFKYLITKSYNSWKKVLKIVGFPIATFMAALISFYFIMDKIENTSSATGSYSIRLDDFKVGFEAWKNNFFFGHGYERHDITQTYMSSIRGTDIGGSSGLMMILPQGGLYLLLIYSIPLIISIQKNLKDKNYNQLIFIAAIVLLFIFTNIPYTYIMIYLLAVGLSKIID